MRPDTAAQYQHYSISVLVNISTKMPTKEQLNPATYTTTATATANSRRRVALAIQNRKQRLRALGCQLHNKVCAECPERDPTWASLLLVATPDDTCKCNSTDKIEKTKLLGLFCCFRCYTFHFQLCKEGVVKAVKSVKVAEECKSTTLYIYLL